tara:strand:+ start:178 stop:564 length:387 start_codon:yes stop_codon:yes gene_type:complete
MKNYILYDLAGNILRTGICPDNMLALEAKEGERVIEGIANDATQIVVDGNLQSKPVDKVKLKAHALDEMRVMRNAALSASDWTQMIDAPITKTKKAKWKSYRQALRDMPQNSQSITSAHDIIWPVTPE